MCILLLLYTSAQKDILCKREILTFKKKYGNKENIFIINTAFIRKVAINIIVEF